MAASGALWGAKGDVRNDEMLIECKTTDKPYYVLSATTWFKIFDEAIKDGLRVPAMCIQTGGQYGSMCIVMKYDDGAELLKDYPIKYDTVTYMHTTKTFRVIAKTDVIEVHNLDHTAWSPDGLRTTKSLLILPWQMFLDLMDLLKDDSIKMIEG